MLTVPYAEAYAVVLAKLAGLGLEPDRADLCARLFVDASRDGVASHGLNRFPGFVASVRRGVVNLQAQPVRVASLGALERWDGQRGPGNLNAHAAMARAIALAQQFGLGGVGLANTNHWMRGGNYGWQAADAGLIGICWSNTMPNMPPWGSRERQVGNNPLVMAVPRPDGHVVLDMALAQFSYGALARYAQHGEPLPVPGGYDASGQLSQDAQAVLDSGRTLPIGYWKGSGLALMLDLLAALLSGGQATHQIGANPAGETSVSQVFLAFDPRSFGDEPGQAALVDEIVTHFQAGGGVRYPGEQSLEKRRRHLEAGLSVEAHIWERVQAA